MGVNMSEGSREEKQAARDRAQGCARRLRPRSGLLPRAGRAGVRPETSASPLPCSPRLSRWKEASRTGADGMKVPPLELIIQGAWRGHAALTPDGWQSREAVLPPNPPAGASGAAGGPGLRAGRLGEGGSRDQRKGPCMGRGCSYPALSFCHFKRLWLVGGSVDVTAFACNRVNTFTF